MVLKQSEDYQNDIQEAGGTEYIKRGNDRVKAMIDTLVSKTFVFNENGQKYYAAWESESEITSTKDFMSPKTEKGRFVGDKHYAVVNMSNQSKPYDILVQHWIGDKIENSKIEVKSSTQSSMFQKTITFDVNEKGELDSPFIKELKDAHSQQRMTQDFWNLFGKIPDETKRELVSNFKRIIDRYINELSNALGRQEIDVKNSAERLTGKFNRKKVIPELLDKVIGDEKQLTRPFDFDIGLLVDHFNEVQYMHIDDFLFVVHKGNNPLGFKSPSGKELISIEEEFANAKATFYIRKRKNNYSIILHVYGLQRKPDDNFASLTIQGISPIVEDQYVNEDMDQEKNGIEILTYRG